MQVLMDDSVVLIVYALMIFAIAGIFIAAYQIYKKREAEKALATPAASDQLSHPDGGAPGQGSRF